MLRKTFASTAVALALALSGCSQESDPMFNEVAQVTVFSSAGFTVMLGQTLQLEGRAVTWGGDRVDERVTSWKTSSPSIATVSNTGQVTGIATGSTSITATAEGVTSPPRVVNVTSSGGPIQ